jgi:hypothetical protein
MLKVILQPQKTQNLLGHLAILPSKCKLVRGKGYTKEQERGRRKRDEKEGRERGRRKREEKEGEGRDKKIVSLAYTLVIACPSPLA